MSNAPLFVLVETSNNLNNSIIRVENTKGGGETQMTRKTKKKKFLLLNVQKITSS